MESGVQLSKKCDIVFVVQNVCIETWFLGNRRIVKRNPVNSNLNTFLNHYNVVNQDPELMDKMEGFRNKAHFHFSYLKEVFKEHNLRYSKANPKIVLERTYFDELMRRAEETSHLPTLRNLLDLLVELRESI